MHTRVALRPSGLGASAYVGRRGSPQPSVFENVKPSIGSRLNVLNKDFAYLFKKMKSLLGTKITDITF